VSIRVHPWLENGFEINLISDEIKKAAKWPLFLLMQVAINPVRR
jgi:hypothetical protein